MVDQLHQSGPLLAIVLLGLLLARAREEARRRALTWALALGAAFLYRPFHPVQHRYLSFPLDLFGSIALASPLAWLAESAVVPPVLRAIVAVGLIVECSPGFPIFCNARGTVEAIATIARGQSIPIHEPPGSGGWFNTHNSRRYEWKDYRDTLIYLRETTSPTTLIANVLRVPPFPSINGPTGRLSPFRAESGICWMWLVPIDLQPEFAAALEQATDSVVVWSPDEQKAIVKLDLDRLTDVIRRHYRPEARFGRIEVWRRADGPREAGRSTGP